MSQRIPAVLIFSGLDPSGGAGIQADIEALASQGCHACPIITTLTVQDTIDVNDSCAIDPVLIHQQATTLLNDITISAIKIGLLDSVAVIETIHSILMQHPDIPVILDPVLATGAATSLTTEHVRQALREQLIPVTTVLTPNSKEAKQLAPQADNLSACAISLLDDGCEFVLITGTHEPTEKVTNTLYSNNRKLEEFHWPRLQGEYHGSGCTLAASIAGLLAQGNEPFSAMHEAQEYTWQSLKHGYRIGKGQYIPNRFFWATDN
jgi:hydroxymethylpyrimidine/phosphomethylpyrimidine kinase